MPQGNCGAELKTHYKLQHRRLHVAVIANSPKKENLNIIILKGY